MKRIAILVCILAPAALAGCQTIRSHNPFRHREPAYESAQQERPLEVPPGLNQPSTAEALQIPSAGTVPAPATPNAVAQPQTQAATPPEAGVGGSTVDELSLSDTPASAYRRVGLALARGDVGQVTAHDDTALTYQIAVDSVVTQKPQGGFIHRLFHRSHSETVKGTVVVSVEASASGSVVKAQGDPDAVARVIAVLKQRLE